MRKKTRFGRSFRYISYMVNCCYYIDDKLFTLLILTHYAYVFLQRTFDIPDERRRYMLSLAGKRYRGWKAFLTNNYLKDKDGNFLEEAPGRPLKYKTFIDEEDWVKFVNQRDEDFRKRSVTNSAKASKPAYPYKKGRMGYARLEDKIVSK